MKTSTPAIMAVAALLAIGNAANADMIVSYPGSYVFTRGGGQTITTGALTGTLTGIRVVFTYQRDGGSFAPMDVAFTVGIHQWGGYFPLINGAQVGECPTGAPFAGNSITYSSDNLGMGYRQNFNHESVRVGFGNGNTGGACTVSNVTITLLGVIPTPGAAATLSLGGLGLMRRPRRA